MRPTPWIIGHLIAATLALAACGGTAADSDETGPGPLVRPDPVREPDRPTAGTLALDESAISGHVQGQTLHVRIPATSKGNGPAAGELTVSLTSVDGSRTLASKRVAYRIEAGATAPVAAELPVPQVAEQADWVDYNLQVEGAGPEAVRATRSLLMVVAPYEVRLEGPTTVTSGRAVRYRVRAQDPVTYRVLPNVVVGLVVRRGAEVVQQQEAMTSDKGDAVFEVVPEVEGDVQVEARAISNGTRAQVSGQAKVERPGARVLLTTDKPLYQPGQVIHLRALALDRITQRPIAERPAVFEVEDGKGNKIMRRALRTDEYGLASTEFRLGPVLNMGTFKLRALVGTERGERTVEVSRYTLPKFKVHVGAERPWYTPGETVTGVVEAQYFFGRAVAGATVVIEASALDIGVTVFRRVMGKTDGVGRFPYAVELPAALVGLPLQQGSALVSLKVVVTDTAGQEVTQEKAVTVARQRLRLALIPEGTRLVPGFENALDLFVSDPLGAPIAGAAVELSAGGWTASGRTDADGQASFVWTPPTTGAVPPVRVRATTAEGLNVTEEFALGAQQGASRVLVRTDRAVYALGETVNVEVRTATERKGVYLDWVNNGQTVDMRTLDVTDGIATLQVVANPGLVGANRIEAYVVGADGNLVRAGRTFFVRNRGGLTVEVTGDQPQYAPGAPAALTFAVKDENGAPAVAALGVQIVDEAVFALGDARPGLLRTYFELDQKFAQPHYQLRPPPVDLTRVLFEETAAADATIAGPAQRRAAAAMAALGEQSMMGIAAGSWQRVLPAVRARLAPPLAAEKTRLLPEVNRAVEAAAAALRARGCDIGQYLCQGRPYFDALGEEVARRLVIHDFWGNEHRKSWSNAEVLRLVSSGPDEKAGNEDDVTIAFSTTDVKLPTSTRPIGVLDASAARDGGVAAPGPVPGSGAGGTGGSTATGAGGAAGSMGAAADEPRVRSHFPETLFVEPRLITGPDGKATVKVGMADSITSWRVSSVAHTLAGRLGGGVGAVKVFQEFFVDVDFPAMLTRGDEVEFPVAVYNYLDRAQMVRLELQPADWYTARGRTTAEVTLAPGQVTGVRFPVRVERVGRQTLTVKGIGGQRSDAVARTVLVVPDGKAVSRAQSGSLAAGTTALDVTFPAQAVPGSASLSLEVYPAYLSQVVQGMDSLLRVPSGCFEQTTSTSWPNVLVTDYLKQTNQLKPALALKAESLMSAGYQRLLTFEHRGGGFSWFGTQDPMPYVSITAFGLMQFADMAKVHPVDEAMLERTRRWLLGQQQADGSWRGDRSEFFSFQTSLVRNTAFVLWALASAGHRGPELGRGLAFLRQQLASATDAYTLAMVANAFLIAAPGDPAGAQVLDRLLALKKEQGEKTFWDTAGTQTSFYGGGDDAKVTATALVAHALLLAGADKATADRALAFLTGARDSRGNFGSTQATIWTLRALLLAARRGTEGAVGTFTVEVNGHPAGTLTLTPDQADVVTTIDLAPAATPGAHRIALSFAGTGQVSYNLVARHHVPWPMMPPAAPGPLAVTVAYDKTRLALDDTATATVTVRNLTRNRQDMIMVTVGVPPGFQIATEDLDAYKAQRRLSQWELTGKQLILYLTGLNAASSQAFRYRLRALMPVRAADGGAEAYLYYQPQQTASAPAITLEVMGAP